MHPASGTRFPKLWRATLVGLAGIYGAAGVMLAAVAAHVKGGPTLTTAADFLMIHAGLVVGLAALSSSVAHPRGWLFVATMVLVAALFFSGDLTLATLAERRLFPMAAPVGGTLLIVCWLGVSALAVWEMFSPGGRASGDRLNETETSV